VSVNSLWVLLSELRYLQGRQRIDAGAPEVQLKVEDGTTLFRTNLLAANDAGALVFAGGCDKGYSRNVSAAGWPPNFLAGNSTKTGICRLRWRALTLLPAWNDVALDSTGGWRRPFASAMALSGTYLFQDGHWVEMATFYANFDRKRAGVVR